MEANRKHNKKIKKMLYNTESDKWLTKTEIIKIIQNQNGCTESEALNHIDYSIKHRILCDYNTYMKEFAPYEN